MTVRSGPGATLGDVDHETQAFGVAVPVGINTTTGIAGLTLGGGLGWISRKHGLTVDSFLSADVVLADGRLVHASPKDEPELFWGPQGGGGNLGIVTPFEFQARRHRLPAPGRGVRHERPHTVGGPEGRRHLRLLGSAVLRRHRSLLDGGSA